MSKEVFRYDGEIVDDGEQGFHLRPGGVTPTPSLKVAINRALSDPTLKFPHGGKIEIRALANDPPVPTVTVSEKGKWMVYSPSYKRPLILSGRDLSELVNITNMHKGGSFTTRFDTEADAQTMRTILGKKWPEYRVVSYGWGELQVVQIPD